MSKQEKYSVVVGEGLPLEGPSSRGYPIRIHVYLRSTEVRGTSLMRLLATIRDKREEVVKSIELVGFWGWRPLALFGETVLPPGDYEVSLGDPAPGVRFRVPSGGGPPVFLCVHAQNRTTIVTRSILDMKGRVLYGGQDLVLWPCCDDLINNLEAPESYGLALYLPQKGVIRLKVNGRSREVSHGEYLVINPVDRVQLMKRQSWPLSFRTVIIEQTALRRFRESVGLPKVHGPFQFASGPRPLKDRLASAVEEWVKSWQARDLIGYEEYVGLATRRLFLELINHHPNTFTPRSVQGVSSRRLDARIQAVLTLMEERISQNLTMEVITREVGVSDSWLEQNFKLALRRSPMEYLRALRMQKAMELLKDRSRSMAEVVHAVGFRDLKWFRRVFRNYTQANPRR